MPAYSIRKWLSIPQYKITRIIGDDDKEIHVWLEPYQRKAFVCSGCGEVHEAGYHGIEESVVEDLALFEKRVYLHVVKRGYGCPKDKRIHIEEVPWVKKWGRVTKRFAEKVNRLTAITTNQEAGWFWGLDDEVVYRIDKETLEEKAREKLMPPPAAINISLDEVSYRKYHRYLTNVINVDERLVIWNDKGRKAEVSARGGSAYGMTGQVLCRYRRRELPEDRVGGIRWSQASRQRRDATNRYAVNAVIVHDKFHLMQKLNPAFGGMDMVRKEELRKAGSDKNNERIELTNCRQRFILFKNKNKLTEKQASYLLRLCEINQPIYPRQRRG
ncbi:MAG TPA: transposase [candidate division Zixibacteria bacterium]